MCGRVPVLLFGKWRTENVEDFLSAIILKSCHRDLCEGRSGELWHCSCVSYKPGALPDFILLSDGSMLLKQAAACS